MARKQKNQLQLLIERIPAPLRNRYFLTLGAFVFWMIFVDRHNVLTQWHLANTLENLEDEQVDLREKIEIIKEDRKDFDRNLEKFAREKYFMRKKDEDVFIIEEREGGR